MRLMNITKCRSCGGTSLTWGTAIRVCNDVQQNRLNTSDVECVFFLGCDDCSETLAQAGADSVAAMLSSGTPAERDERADFLAWANKEYEIGEGYELNESNFDLVQNWLGWQARAALERKS